MPSPRLPRVAATELPDDLREAHQRSMELRGDATFFEVFGNHPALYRWYVERFYGEVFYTGRVDRQMKELLRYRLSTTHGCRFCNQGNRADSLAAGLDERMLAAIDKDKLDELDGRARAVIQLADRMALTNPGGELDAETHAALRRYFDDADILELGLVAGVLAGMAKFLFAFDLVEREANCPIPASE